METNRKIWRIVRGVLIGAFIVVSFAWASRSDYEDAVYVEMMNNGWADRLADAHPDASQSELVAFYLEATDK